MDNSISKERILERIRNGLKNAQLKEIDESKLTNQEIFVTPKKPLLDIFENELTKINGQFFYCQNKDQLVQNLKQLHAEKNLNLCYSPDNQFIDLVSKADITFTKNFEQTEEIKSGISACEFLIARYGSVMVSSKQPGARRIFSFPEIHIVIAFENQLVLEIEDGLEGLKKKYGSDLPSQITNITGPSRTADIEKTLILGAHGPKQLIVFVLKTEQL